MAVLHGYLQLAKRTAEQAPYQIRKGTRAYIVWQTHPQRGWTSIASFTTLDLAEDFICGQIAVMGDY